jgi:prepilin-type N-terminal cleavage/methylation domain-containing protein
MKTRRGFTIVEFALTIAILGVAALLVAPSVSSAIKDYNLVWSRRLVVNEAREGLDRMVREIRLVPGSAQITTVSATSLVFQYPTGTPISYSLSGGNLLRNSDILVSNVSSLAFTYYDEVGAATSVASAVRSVGIQLTAGNATTGTMTLRTRVFLTNTGNDYAHYTSP